MVEYKGFVINLEFESFVDIKSVIGYFLVKNKLIEYDKTLISNTE